MTRVLLVLCCVLLPSLSAAKPKKKPAPAPIPVVVEPVVVAEIKPTRVDGLLFIHQRVAGPGVSVRLFIRMDHPPAEHPARSAALVTSAALLWNGPAAEKLTAGGVGRSVEVVGSNVVLGLDTIRERWTDDVGALLDAVSSPVLSDTALRTGAVRVTPTGPPVDVSAMARNTLWEFVPRDVSLTLLAHQPVPVNTDAAVWHLEEMWTSDRMVLVVTGDIPVEDVVKMVDARFLIPSAGARPRPSPDALHAVVDSQMSARPGGLIYGQWARDVPVQDALILAALLHTVVDAEDPAAGQCVVEYLPHATDSAILAACSEVKNDALDVKNTLTRALEAATLPPPTPEQWDCARKLAVARLMADQASSARLAMRLGRYAAAGWDGGPQLDQAVLTTPETSLQASLATLLGPTRAIRIKRTGGTE